MTKKSLKKKESNHEQITTMEIEKRKYIT